jgi:hypothetical protein
MNIDPDNAGDLRRAGVFIKHHVTRNGDGMNAILQEALDVRRASHFIDAVLATFDAIVPQLVTPAGQRAMGEMILILTQDAEAPNEHRRAARFLISYGLCSRDDMNKIMRETNDVSPMVIAVLDIYATILPTPFGLDIIDRGIRTLSAKEVEGDR